MFSFLSLKFAHQKLIKQSAQNLNKYNKKAI